MKTYLKLEFCEEEEDLFLVYAHARDTQVLLSRVQDKIYNRRKYTEGLSEEERNFLEEIQDILYVDWL